MISKGRDDGQPWVEAGPREGARFVFIKMEKAPASLHGTLLLAMIFPPEIHEMDFVLQGRQES